MIWFSSNARLTSLVVFVILQSSIKPHPKVRVLKNTPWCASAHYYYSIVAVETLCPKDCIKRNSDGFETCTDEAFWSLCKDSRHNPKYIPCDFGVQTELARDYCNTSITPGRPVTWYMSRQSDPGVYFKATKPRQYVYEVNDWRVGPANCATLIINIIDTDGRSHLTWRQVDGHEDIMHERISYPESIKLHLPVVFDGNFPRMGFPLWFSQDFNSHSECNGRNIGLTIIGVVMYVSLNTLANGHILCDNTDYMVCDSFSNTKGLIRKNAFKKMLKEDINKYYAAVKDWASARQTSPFPYPFPIVENPAKKYFTGHVYFGKHKRRKNYPSKEEPYRESICEQNLEEQDQERRFLDCRQITKDENRHLDNCAGCGKSLFTWKRCGGNKAIKAIDFVDFFKYVTFWFIKHLY